MKKINWAMLNAGIRYFLLLAVSMIVGCSSSDEIGPVNQISKSIVGPEEHQRIYEQITDSLEVWRESKLHAYKFFWKHKGKLDSTICFNKEKNKLVGALLVQCISEECLQDTIHFFYGVKIKGMWYFLNGATIVLPREMYQDDVDRPIPFEKLHKIAQKEIFKRYLVKKNEKWEVNERYFQYHFENGAYNYPYTTQEAWEASYIKHINENWKKRD